MIELPTPQFGEIPNDTDYIERPGSYALILNKKRELAVVDTDWGHLYLPGGGIDPGESKELALHREVMEETGLFIQIKAYLGSAKEYFYSSSRDSYFNKIAHFFIAEPIGLYPKGKVEDDHELLWMPPKTAFEELHTDAYSWLVKKHLL
ncbi:MAG: NUDIX hydrolase [Bacteroidota bacterium]